MKANIILTGIVSMSVMISACNSENKTSDNQDSTITSPNVTASPLDSLKTFSGKYPEEVGLLENKTLQARLTSLLGDEYPAFRKSWNTESPIVVEANIFGTSGCEQHNCGDNSYWLFINFSTDNINVYHIVKGHLIVYKEKEQFELQGTLKRDFDAATSDLKL